MKKIYGLFALLMAALITLPSCSKDDPFPWNGETDATGSANFRKMMVEVNSQETEVRSSADVSAFLVEITDDLGVSYYTGTYAELPEVLTLPVGDAYTVTVKSPENPDADWEKPYYEGKQTFSIKENDITFVDPVVCRLANIKVTVRYTEELRKVMGDDCTVEVVAGETGRIVFTRDESRSANFRYVANGGTSTLVATFHGTVEDNVEDNFRTYTDVAPGNHYIITYSLHSPDGPVPDQAGKLTPGVYVDATVVEENMNINVDVDDDILADDKRPSEGGGDDPNPPTPGEGPTVVATIDGATDFTMPYMVHDGMEVKVKVDSKADGGVKVFTVDIDSETLDASTLGDVGLANHLDLVNPGEFADKLSGMGFPINVGGMTDIPQFDISDLVPLLNLLGEPGVTYNHKFILTVGDADGTTVYTLHFTSQK